jgi:hypothetical protein
MWEEEGRLEQNIRLSVQHQLRIYEKLGLIWGKLGFIMIFAWRNGGKPQEAVCNRYELDASKMQVRCITVVLTQVSYLYKDMLLHVCVYVLTAFSYNLYFLHTYLILY